MVSGEPRSLKRGDFSLWRRSSTRVFEIVGCLSKWGRYESVASPLCVICKIFPYMNFREDQVWPHWTRQLLSTSSAFHLSIGHPTRQVLVWLHRFLCWHPRPSVYSCVTDGPIGVVNSLAWRAWVLVKNSLINDDDEAEKNVVDRSEYSIKKKCR